MGPEENQCGLESIEAQVKTIGQAAGHRLTLVDLAQRCTGLADELTLLMQTDGDLPRATANAICRELLIAMHKAAPDHLNRPRLPDTDTCGLGLLQFVFDVIDWAGGPGIEPQLQAVAHHPRASAEEANTVVREYLRHHHDASQREVARGVGCSVSTVGRTAAWKAVAEARRKYASAAAPPAVSLSDEMQNVLGQSDQVLQELIDEQTLDQHTDRVMARQRI